MDLWKVFKNNISVKHANPKTSNTFYQGANYVLEQLTPITVIDFGDYILTNGYVPFTLENKVSWLNPESGVRKNSEQLFQEFLKSYKNDSL